MITNLQRNLKMIEQISRFCICSGASYYLEQCERSVALWLISYLNGLTPDYPICKLFAFQQFSTVIPAINYIFLEIVILRINNFSFF